MGSMEVVGAMKGSSSGHIEKDGKDIKSGRNVSVDQASSGSP